MIILFNEVSIYSKKKTNEFCNPTLWPTQPININMKSFTCDLRTSDNGGEYSHLFEMCGEAHYKSFFASLLSLLASLSTSPKVLSCPIHLNVCICSTNLTRKLIFWSI